MSFLSNELVDIIEWLDESRDTMVWRFPRPNNDIKNGAQLIVRPGQAALLVDQGRIADEFGPGPHTLATRNLPVLTRLRGWQFGFQSPFKVEVLFVNTTQFTNCKWGTSNPVIVRDPQLGPVRLRAYGTYAVRVDDPAKFVNEIVGTNAMFTVDQINEQLRDMVVSNVSTALAGNSMSILDLAGHYAELGGRVQEQVAGPFSQYGLEIAQLVVENVSLPAEVEAAIDTRAKLGVIGNLDDYTRVQGADALRDAARNPGGGASAGIGIGLGAALAQSSLAPQRPAHASTEPPPIPETLWYYAVGSERHGPIDLAGLKAAGVKRDTLLWKSGMSEWTAANSLPDVMRVIG